MSLRPRLSGGIESMTYVSLPVPADLPEPLRDVARVIDGALLEIRSIMTDERLYDGPTDRFQKSLATLLLSATDGAAQLLIPGAKKDSGKRFRKFLLEYFPWNGVEMDLEEAREYLWLSARCLSQA